MGLTQISTAGVKDDAVTASKLPADSVGASELADNAVDTAAIAADAVTGAKIADDAIDSEHLVDGSIDTAHIGADQVTGAKIADDAIDSEHIADGAIDTAHIAADQITAAKIADDVINSEHIAAGAVDLEHMSSESVDEDNLQISNAGTNGQFLSKQSGNTGGLTWADVSSGPGRNILINGDMRICQRSTSTTSINAYIVDRWRSYGGALGATFSQQTDATAYPRSQTALRLHRTDGDSQTNPTGLGQGVETLNSKIYAGETLTLSFKARCGANFSATSSVMTSSILAGEGTDETPFGMTNVNSGVQNNTLTTSVQSFSHSYAVPADKTQLTVSFAYTPTGTAGANDWFEITEVQLEHGTSATSFDFRDYQSELLRCQRYYYSRQTGDPTNYYPHRAGTANFFLKTESLPVEMRVVPTYTYTGNLTLGVIGGTRNSVNSSAVYWNSAGQDGYMYIVRFLNGSSGTQGGEIFNLSSEL